MGDMKFFRATTNTNRNIIECESYSEFDIPYDISWEQVVSITNIKQTKLEGDNDISCRGNVILKNSPFNETEGEIYFFKDRKRWYYEIKPLE